MMYEVGVSEFFKMSPDVIEEFSIHSNDSHVVRRRSYLAQQHVLLLCVCLVRQQ